MKKVIVLVAMLVWGGSALLDSAERNIKAHHAEIAAIEG